MFCFSFHIEELSIGAAASRRAARQAKSAVLPILQTIPAGYHTGEV
jgi:hypothetical protein